MDWDQSIAMERTGSLTFRASFGSDWSSLQGIHGGLATAMAVRAAGELVRETGIDETATLRAMTVGFARGSVEGPADIEVEVVRKGRTMVTTHARVLQGGGPSLLVRCHHSTPWDGLEYSDVPPAPVMPAGCTRLDINAPTRHLSNVETHLHPSTAMLGGGNRSEWLAWCRPKHGGTFDAVWLTMFGDYFPPAVFARRLEPSRALSIEYSLQIHRAEGEWTLAESELLPVRYHAFHSHDGFAVEDGWIYLPDGSLLATVRQTRLAG
jgi:acyl-CoA thioesterase